jgi:magnesium-transporting ATPase (P-type)
MDINALTLYIITRLDNVHLFLSFCLIESVASIVVFFIHIAVWNKKKTWILVCGIIGTVVFSCCCVLIPTTKEAAIIFGVPKIINSDFAQKFGTEFQNLMIEKMK